MSFGKSGGTNVTVPEMTPEQRQQIAAQNEFFTGTIAPTYEQAVKGATALYEQGAPGATYAAQNLGGVAGQAQMALGSTGESALRSGITGLQNLFTPEYERQQLDIALQPAQAQYMQNLADQRAAFGGAGNLGSSRAALAQGQLAGQAMQGQQTAAAGVLRDINAQRLGAAGTLAGLGQAGIGQAVTAAGQGVTASMVPQDLFNKYASVIFGTPTASYDLGPTGTSTTTSGYQAGFGGSYGSSPFGIKI